MAETVTLEFLAAQQRRILDEIASMRDDIKLLTAIVLRHEETLTQGARTDDGDGRPELPYRRPLARARRTGDPIGGTLTLSPPSSFTR
jgi:hypothetical protein